MRGGSPANQPADKAWKFESHQENIDLVLSKSFHCLQTLLQFQEIRIWSIYWQDVKQQDGSKSLEEHDEKMEMEGSKHEDMDEEIEDGE